MSHRIHSKHIYPIVVAGLLSLPAAALAEGDKNNLIDEVAITTEIKAEMVDSEILSAFDIDVDTEGSVVSLEGTVHTPAEKAEAERIAMTVEGVTQVKNMITVTPRG